MSESNIVEGNGVLAAALMIEPVGLTDAKRQSAQASVLHALRSDGVGRQFGSLVVQEVTDMSVAGGGMGDLGEQGSVRDVMDLPKLSEEEDSLRHIRSTWPRVGIEHIFDDED